MVEGEDYYLIDPAKVVYFKASTLDESSVYATLRAEKTGEYNVTLIYRVEGMNWKSRYKLYIGERAKLQGYVVITNPTAVELESADVLLVAGDVQLYQTLPGPREVYPPFPKRHPRSLSANLRSSKRSTSINLERLI
ncbi:hypothetical protein [Thermococcus sp. JCM 11816]|uniref:hypothetical protein n=1 Tax=Thermococcus sp. (strain JCM 11816 / KS-1) TaxID=1295125 RepID=UPI000AC29B97